PLPMTPPPMSMTPLPHQVASDTAPGSATGAAAAGLLEAALAAAGPRSQLHASTPLPSLDGASLPSPYSTSSTPLSRLIMDVPAPPTLHRSRSWRAALALIGILLAVGILVALASRRSDSALDQDALQAGN